MKKRTYDPIKRVDDDGLYISQVGYWAEEKYRLIGEYANMFTTAMRGKWDKLVYIDLFANCGYAKIRDTNKIIQSSAMIALSLPNPFSKYIICEQQEEPFNALKARIARDFGNADVDVLCGDCNELVHSIASKMPQYSKNSKVLTFCFVDPYKIDSLKFNTLRVLSQHYMDFLVLLPLLMDANRNKNVYIRPDNKQIDGFLGDSEWRPKYKELNNEETFVKFLADQFDERMGMMKFESNQMHLIKAQHLKLYYLAFYSRHELGSKFWQNIQIYSTGQQSLF